MSPNTPTKTENPKTISNISIVNQLRKRELHGTFKRKHFEKAGSSQLFCGKIPSRLAYNLRDVVGNELVFSQELHVFLGFSSDGVFVISYTKTYDNDFAASLPVPGETYHLHWWLFNAHNKMVKVKSLKLFENEEISGNDLALHYVEWPTERSKIVVYGVVLSMNTAYVTVASTPPTSKCYDCLPLEDDDDSNLCIQHGFSAHLKYCLDGPTKNYNILHGFNINNLIIINMGYSISVTSLGYLPEDKSTAFLPLSSIKRAADEKKSVGCTKRGPDEDLMNQDLFLFHSELINTLPLPVDELFSIGTSSQTESEISAAKYTESSSLHSWSTATPTDDNSKNSAISLHSFCSCKPDTIDKLSSDSSHDPYLDFGHKTIVLSTPICGRNLNTNSASDENFCGNLNSPDQCAQHVNTLPSFDPYAMPLSPINNQSTVTISLKLRKKVCSEEKAESKLKVPARHCGFCGLEYQKKNRKTKNTSDEESQHSKSGPNFQKPKAKLLKFPPSCNSSINKNDTFMSTPSPSASESGSSIYCLGSLNSENHSSFSDNIVSFTETIYGPTHSTLGQESTDNSNYIGPATLFGANNLPLSPLKPENYKYGTAFSQHLVLDIEHLIFDVLRTRCYKTYKFGYLIDYVAQIIDTCANTYSVIIVIQAILSLSSMKAKHPKENTLKSNSGSGRNLLKFQVFLSWQLQTGRYEVIGASPLILCNKENAKVNMESITRLSQLIRQRNYIPKRHMHGKSSVYVLNNKPVLKEKSLDILWDADHIIALKL